MESMPTDDDHFEKQLKMVVLGEPSTGKSCILSRFCHNEFSRQYYPTLGVDFILQRHEIRNGKNVTLVIWDIGGQALGSTMMENYLYAANIILIVFDITNAASFKKLSEWLDGIRKIYFETSPNIAIIANKCDMEHQRAVSVEKQVRFANEHGFTSHTVSARTGENVRLTIQKICAEKLGLKLTRVEQEAHQTVVQAEIIAPSQNQVYPTYQPTPSTICAIQ
ncbi:ras-related protein Rab-28-like isoform X2 [Cimex lectularius]|uniref:Ras-related protein Rab-28 n=1 Tax=Cimex lectularius TaxID=79782 RepID=A0A8I6RUB5_CIMLE|nr:ras-related protein Rab-28-like isoform X2 [Cimex lectularius]